MKRSPIVMIVMIVCAASVLSVCSARADSSLSVRLPYEKGQSFILTQGYVTPPTHIKKDAYALDLTKNGCDAYGLPVVAAVSGTAMFMSQEGYNGGYGTELIINHGGNIVSRYAHMIPDSIAIAASGTTIRRGQTIGLVGDTGLVAGAACAEHPGTHLHFAMDTVNADGTFSAYGPEPISGYTNMTAGKWYLSDNGEDDTSSTAMALVAPATFATSSVTTGRGVSIVNAGISSPQAPVPAPTIDTADASSTASSTASTSSAPAPAATGTLFAQLDDSANSHGSWYDDNWYDLGNGFTGTLTTLTLEGAVSDRDHFASHVSLQEFKDKDYTVMVRQFPISDDASFTPAMATTTFDGLSIPLKPYFYYRLATMQDYQNRSVILAGTATTTTGTAMWDNFIYGTGQVQYTEPFFPFMIMEGAFETSTPAIPPPLTTPANLAETFDSFGMHLNISFSTSTDPDWPANPLHYQMNYSTSTILSDDEWIDPGSIPLTVGNSYLVGIRAVDNYGDVSAPATATWNFPAGFAPYLLSPKMNDASQYFTVPSTSTLQSIQLFTTDFETNTWYPTDDFCSLQLFDEYNLSSYGMTQSDNGFNGGACADAPVFSFASSSPALYPDHRYHWVFGIQTASPLVGATVRFYGTATDTAGGPFNDPSLANAKFTVIGDTGVLFSN